MYLVRMNKCITSANRTTTVHRGASTDTDGHLDETVEVVTIT